MKRIFVIFVLITSFFCIKTYADEMEYKQQKLPDGSMETDYSNSDGSKVKQIQHPDGTIETHAIDAQGTETITMQHPNGNVEMQTKTND